MKNGHKGKSCMSKTKCHLNNSSSQSQSMEFGCIIALGWEASRCPLTAVCANTQFAPVPWMSGQGVRKCSANDKSAKKLAMSSSLFMPFPW